MAAPLTSKLAPVGILLAALLLYVGFGDGGLYTTGALLALIAAAAFAIVFHGDTDSEEVPNSGGSKSKRKQSSASSTSTEKPSISVAAPTNKAPDSDADSVSLQSGLRPTSDESDAAPSGSDRPGLDSDQDSVDIREDVSGAELDPDAQLREWMNEVDSESSDSDSSSSADDGDADGNDEQKLDTTPRAADFWKSFGVDPSTIGSNGVAASNAANARPPPLEQSREPLPPSLDPFSSQGIVRKGHVEIDSDNEEDEILADTVISGSSRYDVGFADTKGKRSTMEDEMVVYGTFRESEDEDYVAVFDGHGGSEASALAAEELHEQLAFHLDQPATRSDPAEALRCAFNQCQKVIESAGPDPIHSGTTAVVCYIKGNRAYVANAGDSRAVLAAKDGSVRRVTIDHKPSLPKEEARIKEAGGFVTRLQTKRGEISRVCAILGVARALGDVALQPMVTCNPDVFTFDVSDQHLLIMACDGLWDVVEDDEAVEVALSASDAGEACVLLRNLAYARRSDDNISILVVDFKSR